jgi:oligopeptide transport system permease protein
MASSAWRDAVAVFARNRLAVAGLALLCVFGLMALLAPWIDHHGPNSYHVHTILKGPSRNFWLGTDAKGRDEYSRLVHGARISLAVGVFSQVIGVSIGLAVGITAGLGGRRTDTLLMRLTDIAYSFPALLLLILLVSVFGPSALMILLAIGLVSWTTIARLVRGQVLSLREEQFVVAARALGASDFDIARRHVLPNLAGPVVVATVFGVPEAIFAEAALSFIGLGVRVPTATWGNLIVDSKSALVATAYPALFSCSTVALTMMSFMLVGDGLRDALDPRTARRRRRPVPDEAPVPTRQPRELPKAA